MLGERGRKIDDVILKFSVQVSQNMSGFGFGVEFEQSYINILVLRKDLVFGNVG